ncbi:Beta-glucan synthesis-associated protein [Mycena indigotica]|uniref:Beta-glucan synthesis-associated protein n=1 Tax=Mycena indigotica TaxID=2126181 RepID=A0A8H6SY31_9AGAR|nr:Beta-glucan synthesis-associated protein [Mycena indigotica]KAF7306776.1 Beta-glucan synthesis-associated protein [Mycena indigotica]
MPPNQYPFAAPSSSIQGAPVGPNAQRRYFQQPAAQPSSANLLPSSRRFSNGSTDSFHSQSTNHSAIHANLARGPSTKSNQTFSSNQSPYSVPTQHAPSVAPSLSDKFSLSPDPAAWGADINHSEPDDFLHNPDPRRDRKNDRDHDVFTLRGVSNLGCLLILGVGLVTLFAGYPLISHFQSHPLSFFGGFNVGGTNATGQVPSMTGNFGLIDVATPKEFHTINSYHSPNEQLQLVFSDEFEVEGRSFYPGDDPYWEAVDLHYWQTNNLEWYDPAAVTTRNGALEITLSKKETHDLNYEGGMLSTWNKFCFTGGVLIAAVNLPGTTNVHGLWPAVWAMGNLGRAGFGASLDGMWPYRQISSYDSCDVGTAPNQTVKGLPLAATINGDPSADDALSYLPGQRLSRCTCPGESHPGPIHADGTLVGRAAPEIDVFEAQIGKNIGQVSQSCQWAPFNNEYKWFNTSDNLIINDPTISELNSYLGGAFQQATSVVSNTNQQCYQLKTTCFEVFGFEYKPGMHPPCFAGAYISWIANNKLVWTLNQGGMAADPVVQIGERPIPQEPMYIIANLGMSLNFGAVDFERLTFPAVMRVDYIRVYQPKNAINIGCDPANFPTQAYINEYIEAYTNPNLTTWEDDFKQPIPKSSILGQC